MCCLKYEEEVYEEKNARLPGVGAIVKTPEGEGEVEGLEILKEIVRVKIRDREGNEFHKKYELKDIKILKDVDKNANNEEEDEELKKLEKLGEMEIQSSQEE